MTEHLSVYSHMSRPVLLCIHHVLSFVCSRFVVYSFFKVSSHEYFVTIGWLFISSFAPIGIPHQSFLYTLDLYDTYGENKLKLKLFPTFSFFFFEIQSFYLHFRIHNERCIQTITNKFGISSSWDFFTPKRYQT